MNKLPRWLLIAIIIIGVTGIVTGLVFMIRSGTGWVHWTGLILTLVLIAIIISLVTYLGPQLYKLYKFQKKLNNEESGFRELESMLAQGRVHEATQKFKYIMKDAPDSAYIYYMKAVFLKNTGNNVEAYKAAKSALGLANTDASLNASLEQGAGQMGLPTTKAEFKIMLRDMIAELEPKVKEQQTKKEKAVQKRKRKSR